MEAELYQAEPVLSQAALYEVEGSAYAQLSIAEIAILAEVDEIHALRWMNDRHHPFFVAVNRGRLRFIKEMNLALIPLAQMGESGALISIEKAMERQRILDA